MTAVPERLPGSSQLLIDSVCARFEAAWPTDQRLRIEDCLSEVAPELQSHLLFELIALELELRADAGGQPDRESYRGRFPGRDEILELAFAEWQQNSALRGRADDSRSLPSTVEFTALQSTDGFASRPATTSEVPRQVPGYSIRQLLGRGGMGVVVRAWDEKLHRDVALKMLLPQLASDPQCRQRFLREARASAAIRHPNVVAIHAVEEAHDPPFLVLELVEGMTLAERLQGDQLLPLDETVRIAADLAAGLAAAHAKGLIHRDIKPGNILLEAHDGRARLTDFGLARVTAQEGVTTTGLIAGTPQYMSPEQIEGRELDPRSDLFSLGAVLYRMATGRSAFSGESVITLARQICDHTPQSVRTVRADVPEWFSGIIQQLMARRPEDRIQSADELVRLLKPFASLKDSGTLPLYQIAATRSRAAVAKRVWIGIGVIALAMLAGVLLRDTRVRTPAPQELAPAATTKTGSEHEPLRSPATQPATAPAERTQPAAAVVPFDARMACAHQEAWAEFLDLPVEKVIEMPGNQSLTLVLIPPGEFQMGCPDSERQRLLQTAAADSNPWFLNNLPSEIPQHFVRLTQPFYLAKYELTQAQWLAFMEENPSAHTASLKQPVDHLSWNDAQLFLQKLNAAVKVPGLTFVLPTEAQWEFACRAGTKSSFSFGDDDSKLPGHGWFAGNSRLVDEQTRKASYPTHPVGELLPNNFGLHDMHGNVWEWCEDWFDPESYADSPVDDPAGPQSGQHRVNRGGYAGFRADYSRSAMRGHDDPLRRDFHGLRVAAKIHRQPLNPADTSGATRDSSLEWSAPEHLGEAVNSSSTESSPSLSADGRVLAFLSRRTGQPLPYLARRASADEPFQPAEPLDIDLSAWPVVRDVGLSGDALTLAIALGPSQQQLDLYHATRASLDVPWSKLEPMTAVNSPQTEYSPKFSTDGLRLVFHSDRIPAVGQYDLWEARRAAITEPFENPVLLAEPVSSPIAEENPVLTSDNLGLYFTRDWTTPRLLYAVRPAPDAPFGEPQPVNLPGIAEGSSVRAPTLTADGRQMIFSATRPGGLGASDLWLVRRVRR